MSEQENPAHNPSSEQPEDGLDQEALLQMLFETLAGRTGDAQGDAVQEAEEFSFVSVMEASQSVLIDRRRGVNVDGARLRAIADWIISNPDISATADHLHVFINLLIDKEDWLYVAKLAGFALQRYPYHIDLLGDVIQACAHSANFTEGQRYVDVAVSIPKEYWDWYLAVWVCEFYKEHLNVCPPDERGSYLDKGLDTIRQYRQHFPLDERAYNQEAEMLLLANRKDEARDVLESAIFEKHGSDNGVPCRIAAAQCCVTYLDMVKGTDNYEDILRIAQKGIGDAAQDKPSARVGYFLFHEALALDAKLCSAGDSHSGYRNSDQVEEVLVAYEAAHRLNKGTSYSKVIKDRYAILCGKCRLTDRTLPE